MTKVKAEIEANILRAQVAELHQGAEHASQQKEQLEEQLQEAREQWDQTLSDLHTAQSKMTEQAGDLTYCRARVGK